MFPRMFVSLSLLAGLAAPALAQSSAPVSMPVKGDVAFEITVISGDLRIVAGKAGTIEAQGEPGEPIELSRRGNRIVAEGKGVPLRSGDVTVRVPPGTSVFAQTISGDLELRGVGGNADLHTVSGNIEVSGARNLRAAAVSGDITAAQISGEVRAETVSGSARIDSTAGPRAQLEFATTSGDLRWRGLCAAGCRLEAQSLSGTLSFSLAAKSSFEVDFESFSGELDDQLGLREVGRSGVIGSRASGLYGKGAGKIDVNSHSGTLELKKIASAKKR